MWIRSSREQVPARIVMFLAGLSLCLLLSACAAGRGKAGPEPKLKALSATEEALGIRVQGIRRTAEGYMLDFRYQVLDPGKSAPLFDRSIQPYLIDETTGARFIVPSPPKIGALRQTSRSPQAGRTFFTLFANPAKFLPAGRQVTVVIGEHRIEHLIIE